MKQRYVFTRRLIGVALAGLLVAACFQALPAPSARAEGPAPGWHDTGIPLQQAQGPFCFDATQPNVAFVNETSSGTVAYNWSSGQRTVVNSRPFTLCGPQGLLFADGAQDTAWRFSSMDPEGRAIAHNPTHVAQDGTLQAGRSRA
jgi:hypothetical protein